MVLQTLRRGLLLYPLGTTAAPGPDTPAAPGHDTPAARWAFQLGRWAIPEDILAAAPESPWTFPTDLFVRSAAAARADTDPTPSRRRAVEAIPPGGTVLDVVAGAGAASLPLAPPAGRLVAVDESQSMLDACAADADRAGLDHREVCGRWPDISPEVDAADVVVCHHVVYNVADLVPFLTALDRHARRRVVLELTSRHPQSDLNPLWAAIHGIERPGGPTAVTAAEVANSLGYDARTEVFERPPRWHDPTEPDHVAFARRRLCVGPERDADIAAQLARLPTVARQLVTLWWDVRHP